MKCEEFKDLAFSFQDGRLNDGEKAEFERHRRGCPACSSWLRDMDGIQRLLDGAAGPVPIPDWNESWRKIAAAGAPAPRRRFLPEFPRWGWVAAGFLGFFILGAALARLAFPPARTLTDGPAEPAFAFTPQEYFTVLQPVMAAYANAPSVQENSQAEQVRVRRLLNDLYLLKMRAAKNRDASLQHLLQDIELVLLEIIHVDRSDPERARRLGALIQERGISLKIKAYNPDGRKSVRI